MSNKKELPAEERAELLKTLQTRFEKNMNRHEGIGWEEVRAKLEADDDKFWSLNEMEITGGEPDIIGYDANTNEYIFCDCSAESPKGRRSICYDHTALNARKEYKPANSAINMAEEMGIKILNEEQYRLLQSLGKFDTKTSSWLLTPDAVRKHGGAIFGDCRYNHVWTYHNGADSYYAARGFRGLLSV